MSEEVPIAFIATDETNIYLVFRGTKTIEEWIDDVDFPLIFYPYADTDAKSEKGFTDLYNTLGVADQIKMLAETGDFDNLYLKGHSLGAALAVVTIPDIIENTDFKDPIMYSFAGPRVGEQNYKDLYVGYNIES